MKIMITGKIMTIIMNGFAQENAYFQFETSQRSFALFLRIIYFCSHNIILL